MGEEGRNEQLRAAHRLSTTEFSFRLGYNDPDKGVYISISTTLTTPTVDRTYGLSDRGKEGELVVKTDDTKADGPRSNDNGMRLTLAWSS